MGGRAQLLVVLRTKESLLGIVQSFRAQFAAMSKTMKTLTAKISKIDSNQILKTSTVAQKNLSLRQTKFYGLQKNNMSCITNMKDL